MRATVSPAVKIKAAGGVRTLDALIDCLNAGIDRCGATATAAIIDDLASPPVLTCGGSVSISAARTSSRSSSRPTTRRSSSDVTRPRPVPAMGRQPSSNAWPAPDTRRSTDGGPSTDAASACPARSTPMPGRSSCSPTCRDRGGASPWSNRCGSSSTSRCRSSTTPGRSRWPSHGSAPPRAASTAACFVLGTGIGGGVVVDGRLHFGPHGRAGELAHQIVVPDGPPCGCGNRGCVEAVASSRALAALGWAADDRGRVPCRGGAAIERAGAAIADSGRPPRRRHRQHDHVLVPERVVIGGGVAGAGDASAGADPSRRRPPLSPRAPRLVRDRPAAARAPYAGAIGAALWARRARPAEAHGSVSGWAWMTSMT